MTTVHIPTAPASVTLDLAKLGLHTSHDGTCTCHQLGQPEFTCVVDVNLDDNELHADATCEIPVPTGETADALQALHEKAHPDGTLYAEFCREQECRTLADLVFHRQPEWA